MTSRISTQQSYNNLLSFPWIKTSTLGRFPRRFSPRSSWCLQIVEKVFHLPWIKRSSLGRFPRRFPSRSSWCFFRLTRKYSKQHPLALPRGVSLVRWGTSHSSSWCLSGSIRNLSLFLDVSLQIHEEVFQTTPARSSSWCLFGSMRNLSLFLSCFFRSTRKLSTAISLSLLPVVSLRVEEIDAPVYLRLPEPVAHHETTLRRSTNRHNIHCSPHYQQAPAPLQNHYPVSGDKEPA